MYKFIYITILILILLANNTLGSGFKINELGARATGLAGAFTGLANDPSTIYFNPAGITQINGTHFLGGLTLVFPNNSFKGPYPEISESKNELQVNTPIHLYATHQINEKLFLGVGIVNNYQLGKSWKDDWVGRFVSVESKINILTFDAIAAYKISNEVSLGFGYSLAYGDILFGKSLNLSPFNSESYLELEGNGFGAGFVAGLFFHPIKSLSFGLSYRSQVKIDYKGEAVTSNNDDQLIDVLPYGKINTPITYPENISIGIAIKPFKYFTFTADYEYVAWDSYDKNEFQFSEFTDLESEELLILSSKTGFVNGFSARLGVEFDYSRKTTLRAGFLYDKNSVKDELLSPSFPNSDKLGISFGGTYNLSQKVSLDAAYQFIRYDERNISNSLVSYSGLNGLLPMNGIYNTMVHIFSLSIAYSL